MILILSDRCPIFERDAEPYLQSLLFTVVIKRRHIIARPTPDRLKEILPIHLWEVFGEYLKQSPKQVVNSYQRWVQSTDCATCDAAKLAHFYDLPTVLIVENLATDGRWLKFIIGKLRPRLNSHMGEPHPSVEIRQAGGIGEIPKELDRVGDRYRRVRPSPALPLRIIAMADSDARTPGRLSADAQEVEASARRNDAVSHILAKRTIENYIPDRGLRTFVSGRDGRADRRAAAEFIVSLTPPARDHYHVKDGLSRAEIDGADSMYPPGTPQGLGMGDFIIDFIDNFSWSVDANDLQQRDGSNELDTLLDLLEENL